MRRIALALTLLVLPTFARDEEKTEILPPKDPKAVVLSLDLVRSFGPPRKSDEPALSVLSDGTVLARTPLADGKSAKGKLDRAELLELVSFVVVEQKFFEYDPEAVQKKMNEEPADQHQPMVLDGAETEIRVALRDRSHTARQYGLDFLAREYPKIDELTRLVKVSERLNRLRVETIAGGPKRVEEYVALVRAAVENRKSDFMPPTAADLHDAWLLPEGGRRVRFRQEFDPGEDGVKVRGRIVTVVDTGKGDPEISLHRY